ncbi:MAG: 5'/3'-nucleotidase SurE [Anaerovoracaceae bacterium]
MNILVSNDDGINAEGIRVLVKALSEVSGVKIYVCAPDGERSASGHGISMTVPIMLKEENIDGVEWAYALSGTPADCVKFAMRHLKNYHNVIIDAVFAGINHGGNIGSDVYYSGTLAAAAEGALCNVPAVAVSVGTHHPTSEMLNNCKTVIKDVAGRIISEMEARSILNINFPPIPPAEINGLKVTRLGPREYDEKFELLEDPKKRKYYWYCGDVVVYEGLPDELDVMAHQQGYVTVTPLRLELTDFELRDRVSDWKLKI